MALTAVLFNTQTLINPPPAGQFNWHVWAFTRIFTASAILLIISPLFNKLW